MKADLETETSISGIYMLQTQTAVEKLDDGLYELERAVQAEIEKREKAEREETARKQDEPEHQIKEPKLATQPAPVTKPKPVVELTVSQVFSQMSNSVYVESEAEINQFVDTLKSELLAEVRAGKRVRVR